MIDRCTSSRLEIVTDHCYRLHIYSIYQIVWLWLRVYISFRKAFCASFIRKWEMDYNICSGPEITRKTLLISCLYPSYTSSQSFWVGLQTVICFEGIQSFYFSAEWADINPPFITLQIDNHFLPVFSRVGQILHSLWWPCACFASPTCFSLINKITAAAPFLGSKKRSCEYYGEMKEFCAGR